LHKMIPLTVSFFFSRIYFEVSKNVKKKKKKKKVTKKKKNTNMKKHKR